MEPRSREYFLAAADERSFTRAAQRCHVIQSTISAQILGLEKQLGEPLFDRSGREVVLTEGGRVLLPDAGGAWPRPPTRGPSSPPGPGWSAVSCGSAPAAGSSTR